MRTAALLAIATAVLAAQAAAAEPDAVRRMLEERFPVEVLRLDRSELDGRPVYIATVMLQAGDFNDSLQVTRLMVDAASGQLVPQYDPRRFAATGTAHRPEHEGMEALRR